VQPSAAWSDDRVGLHALQRAEAACVGRGPRQPPHEEILVCIRDAAAAGYRAAFPDAELVTFTAVDICFLVDHSTNSERASRTVAAWTYAHTAPSPRDRSRQAGFPLPAVLAEAGY